MENCAGEAVKNSSNHSSIKNIMEQPPSVDEVVACIATLYHDPNPEKKTGANQWLQILQNSVFAWRVRQFLKF